MDKKKTTLIAFALVVSAHTVANAAQFEQLFNVTAFSDRGPGADFFWGGVDDDDFMPLGVNPSGSASYYEFADPTPFGIPAQGALFGYMVESFLSIKTAVGDQLVVGTNTFGELPDLGTLGSFDQNVLLDRSTRTPLLDPEGNPLINVGPPIVVQLDQNFTSTATFNADNTFSLFQRLNGIGDIENTTIEGYYLVNEPGQNDPASVFAGNQKAIDHFNTVVAALPNDWTAVWTAHLQSSNLTSGLSNDAVFTVFSTSLQAIPRDVTISGDVRRSQDINDYFGARGPVGTTLIGESGVGSVAVGAGENVVLNSMFLGFEESGSGNLIIGQNASAAIQPLAFSSDCPGGPNCIGQVFDQHDAYVFAGMSGDSNIHVHSGATLDANRLLLMASGATSTSQLTVDGGTLNLEGIVNAANGVSYAEYFGGAVPHHTQAFLLTGAGQATIDLVNGANFSINRVPNDLGSLGFFGISLGHALSVGGGTGTLNVSGGSEVNVNGDAGALIVGGAGVGGADAGTGVVNIGAHSRVNLNGSFNGVRVASIGESGGEVNIDGPGAILAGADGYAIGWNEFGLGAGTATVNVTNGGTLQQHGDSLTGAIVIGYRGTVNVDGMNSLVVTNGSHAVLNVGASAIPDPDGVSTARLNITNGGRVLVEDPQFDIVPNNVTGVGAFSGDRGEVLIDGIGSVLDSADGVGIGFNPTLIDGDPLNDIAGGQGLVTVSNGGMLIADAGVAVGDMGRLAGNGTVIGSIFTFGNGTVAPGLSPGDLTVDGDFNMAFGGILELEIDDLENFDRVIASGNFSFSALSTIQLIFADGLNPTILESFSIGDFFRLGDAMANGPASAFDLPGIELVSFVGLSNTSPVSAITFDPVAGFAVTAVPVPATLWLMVSAGLFAVSKRRRPTTGS